jgi:SPP1 family phage portal protein|nr:MAG TPA: Portal [Caudoviricetes sp.]
MAEYQIVVDGFLNNPLTGRRPIETPETEINRVNVLKVVMGKAEPIHLLNKNEIRFLHNYYLGSQPVLHRTKEYHSEITNRIVENHANECVGFYTGYMSGTPCSYVRSETATGDGEEIARLSNALQYEGKDALDRRLWQWMLECGQGYRIVLPDKGYNGNYPDETPLLVDVPDPDMAYVIYNSGIGHKPIANVLHIPRNYQNDLNDLICVYTPNQYFEIDNGKVTKSENHSLGMLPMVEYKLNPERMGLFEPAIPVLDAINDLESNRLDGVAQFIQSIMVFTNCLVDKDALDQVKELGAMCLKSTSGLPASVSQIANELDQQQSQTLLDSMLNVYRSLTAMPSATGSENATSDNVGAVIVRNGWNHTEARAQQYENMFKFAERQSLSVMLKILRDTAGSRLMASDVEIRLPRRQYDNLQSKVQVFIQMLDSSADPHLAFEISHLYTDPEAAYQASVPFLIAAGKLGEDGKAPKPQEQPKRDVTDTNVGNMADKQSTDTNKETEGE